MARFRTVNYLPEIFQTDANRQFLAATLDTLVQEPQLKQTQGFIGRTVGPGVIPEDRYVVEPNKTRADYQLEPGVISLDPKNTTRIQDAITYPGILESVSARGGVGNRPDRLMQSDYYTWDPFCNFDSLVNYSQYYWLPNGPDAVDVSTTGTPVTDTFDVTRANGVYTFSGLAGTNPTVELVRGGSYIFNVYQNSKETVNFKVSNQGLAGYTIDNQVNPTITLARGNTYVFNLVLRGPYPFWIKTNNELGTAYAYNDGVTRNGSLTGIVTFVVPQDAPDVLYYVSENQPNMRGVINIVDGDPGTGPGFWIQTEPGIGGRSSVSPNISTREVLGVINNGEDLGTVVFNVPTKTQQNYFYNLPTYSLPVDLISTISYTDLQGQSVSGFLQTYGGIDGISNLNTRTVIFTGGSPGIDPPDTRQLFQITYNYIDNIPYINVAKIADIPNQCKWIIRYGTVYANTQWYKTPQGTFKRMPLLTAALDTLYYQDGTDPGIVGQIRLVDPVNSSTIYIDDILGKKNYTSPNGVTFTNGLKVVFRGDVLPDTYASNTITIDCLATTSQQNLISTYSTEQLRVGQEIIFSAPTLGGLTPAQPYYVRFIDNVLQFQVSATPDGPAVSLANGTGHMSAAVANYRAYYVAGVGTAIQLLPVTNFVTPELYIGDENQAGSAVPLLPDYITIDRASPDHNAWSRSNRWFHIDVIQATAEYNNTIVTLNEAARARRPIIQFNPGIRLFDMGTRGLDPVDVIDFTETDALSNVEGATGYTVYGYSVINGSRIIFANDLDPQVRDKIWQVEFIYPDTVPPLISQPVIHLRLADDGDVAVDMCTVILNHGTSQLPVPTGETEIIGGQSVIKGQAGAGYWYDGTAWIKTQPKTQVQQPPLFNVYDMQGVSFSDRVKYPSTNFVGTRLFSYAISDVGVKDVVLGFPLQYLTINNLGDIVFDNNLYTDQFNYVKDKSSYTQSISAGTPRVYDTRTEYQRVLGWQDAITTAQVYQQFRFTFTTVNLELDVVVSERTDIPVVKVYVNNVWLPPAGFSIARYDKRTVITLAEAPAPDSIVEVVALSEQTSNIGFYQVPINLQNNPFNANSDAFTLGTIRQHYQSICENLLTLSGPVNGANNTRDLGDIVPYGLVILQQSAPLTLAGYFLRSNKFNIWNSLVYNGREYTKYKNLVLENVTQQVINFETAAQVLDRAIANVTQGRVETQPFYWSDMLPSGSVYQETVYPITYITTRTFNTLHVHDYSSANYLGMDVYLDGAILTRGRDYTVATDAATITVITTLSVGQTLTIREYDTTAGSFCPNTPTKLGLYPAWRPEIVVQTTTDGEQAMIIGHDGSATKTFGDIRDSVLLEFETRIYNNLKLDNNPVPLTIADVLPGQFRRTGFDLSEIQNILDQDFLSWIAWNKLDYTTQEFNISNTFTYNYSQAQDRLDSKLLPGAWRGINRYFYDTVQPQNTPWEMLGFSVKPTWWDLTYGTGPYTDGNLVLWDDLEAGIVRDPLGAYVLPAYVRPRLTQVIPSGSEGQLLSPLDTVVGNFEDETFINDWSVGAGGPTEASWWTSSLYPFAVMRVLALTRPAKFFSLFVDRDLYRHNSEFEQYLYQGRYRMDARDLEVYGNGVSKASFMNWIVDYNRQTGLDSTQEMSQDLANLDVRLCYRMASFSDKQYITLMTERSTPNSNNSGFTIPDNSYQLLLYKNQVFAEVTYSSVIVQRTNTGYQVFGYSTLQPYFTQTVSMSTSKPLTITSGGITVQVSTVFSNITQQIPYSTEFATPQEVAQFLLGYGHWLGTQGFVFDNISNGYVLDWTRMASEFLYWAGQDWDSGVLINLNPLAQKLQITKAQSVVDSLVVQSAENVLLDQNRRELPTRNLNIVRLDNTLTVEPMTDQSLSFVDLNFTSYEHMIVLNNRSEFGDLILDPTTGARQPRLYLMTTNTSDWNGSIDTPGFILNRDNIEEWTGLRTYAKGEIVRHKGSYWSAATIVQPSARFNYNDWLQSDYTKIEQGLLPNLANKAVQLQQSYDINQANIDSEQDLFSFGLIGFRPRQYLAALDLDSVSQVNVYRQFLGAKGTKLSAENLRSSHLTKEQADYAIFENWAVQRGVYGANANRSFVEFRLNRALLSANPSTVQVINAGEPSEADQTILLGNIWRQSYKLTTTDIFPTTLELPTDVGLPSAGYVDINDVDITVFDITDPANLSANLGKIGVGTSVWVAKINDYDWNIYRCDGIPGSINHLCDNLDGTSLVIFTQQHGLSVGDRLIIRFFDAAVDGIYRVLSVPSLNQVTIAYQFVGRGRTVIDGTGIGFTLQTMRVAQFSDLVNLPYANQLTPGARAWVDNDGSGGWSVYEKQDIYTATTTLASKNPDATEGYGATVAMGANQQSVLVGSPRYGFPAGAEKGAVYTYVKNYTGTFQPVSPLTSTDAILELGTAGSRGFGSSLSIGNLDWAVAGAPGSLGSAAQTNSGYAAVIHRDEAVVPNTNPYQLWQLLTTPGAINADQAQFGSTVVMSHDERWMYVGAPYKDNGSVAAYTRVEWREQVLEAQGTGSQTDYAFGGTIEISDANQLAVTVNGILQTLGVNYSVNLVTQQVIFGSAPAANRPIRIRRLDAVQLDETAGPTYNLGQYFYQVNLTNSNIYSFQITLNGDLLRPNIDYTFNTVTKIVSISAVLTSGDVLLARASWYWLYVDTITPPTIAGTPALFGSSLACTTDGRQVLIGARNQDVDGTVQAGCVYVYDRDVQRFHYGETSTVTFTVLGSAPNPLAVSVLVNNQFLTPETSTVLDAPNSFTISGNNITVNTDLVTGDFVDIETNQFQLAQVITQDQIAEFSNYGQAVDICRYNCSLYVGAPQSSVQIFKGGVVERSVNQARSFGIIASVNPNPVLTPGDTLRVNNQDVEVPAASGSVTSLQGLALAITNQVPNTQATVTNGLLQITVMNMAASVPGNRLQVAPGTVGTAFDDLGFDTFVLAQTIASPLPLQYAQFGATLTISDTATELLVAAPTGSTYLVIEFDNDQTDFDAGSTLLFNSSDGSGAVYVYDYLSSSEPSVTNPAKFILGQQIAISDLATLDKLGQGLSYRDGVLLMGAPGSDLNDSSQADYGRVYIWQNPTREPAWRPLHRETPRVDIRMLDSVYLYNLVSSATTQFLDFFSPLQGKILGAAQQNIDFISAVDPAGYNVGATGSKGQTWGQDRVGETWWDISSVRFLDSSQDNITYDARQWGQVFPGSKINVYQWIVSATPPANYAGPGQVRDVTNYSVNTVLTREGILQTQYFFWVSGLTTMATNKGKTLSISTVAQYIENPRLSGIAYMAPINANTVALYNCQNLIEAQDTVLHVEFDRELNDDNIHIEYQLIPQDRADGWLSDSLYRKLLDSFCGVDTAGNQVPDNSLSPAERYGVEFRPRQSMFSDRFLALKTYIVRANTVMAQYPIVEMRNLGLLNSEQPIPPANSGEYNAQVADIEILGYQNIYQVPLGYRYLVQTDSTEFGLWTIYQVILAGDSITRELQLIQVQNYRTPDYWNYIDWVRPGYNASIQPLAQVANYSALDTVTVPVGSSVKVLANSRGMYEVYLRTDTGWERVVLQNGTIAISDTIYDYPAGRFGFDAEAFDTLYFDQDPTTETRRILQALNEQIFTDELLIYRNQLLILMFNFVLTEFPAPQWLMKTSLIDVDHRLRSLLPFPNYQLDNQEFVVDYIQEVKPYHVQIRQVNLRYFGQDNFLGDITDFDVPAYYNTALTIPQYVSPILTPYAMSTATGSPSTIQSDAAATDPIWTQWPWSQWYGKYLMLIDGVTVVDGGTGYLDPPKVTIQGDAQVPALAEAVVENGSVVAITITRAGSGYRDQPQVIFSSGSGQGATAYVRLIGQGLGQNYNSTTAGSVVNYNLVRDINVTMKFDRYQYQSQVQIWNPNGTYDAGTLVRYDNRVWRAQPHDASTQVVGPTFNLEDWQPVAASTLSGVDRTQGFYVAGVDAPGLDLPLLIDGISYPAPQVWGEDYVPTQPLDTIYNSSFSDIYLGTRPSDVNVAGGQYVDPYEGHAPQELVNGAEYDSMDLRVYTRPGSDWQRNGHGFQIGVRNFVYDTSYPSETWSGLLNFVANIEVSNITTRRDLVLGRDYTLDWVNQRVIMIANAQVSVGDTIEILAYGAGGGNQLYRNNLLGSDVINNSFLIPVESSQIQSIMILVNGVEVDDYTWEPYTPSVEWNQYQSYTINTVVNDSGSTGPDYYRAISTVPPGTPLDNTTYWQPVTTAQQSRVFINAPVHPTDGIAIVVLGQDLVSAGEFIVGRSYTIITVGNTNWIAIGAAANSVGETFVATAAGSGSGTATTIYGWSTAQIQYVTANHDMISQPQFTITLTNSVQGENSVNLVATRNGLRLTPPAGIEWFGDGTTNSFGLPRRLGSSFSQSLINPATDIVVWIDDILQVQANTDPLNPMGDYYVNNDTTDRQVIFNVNPPDGARILITVNTLADYVVGGNTLVLKNQPNLGDVFAITTWNDTSQQNIETKCFYGPQVTGVTSYEGFDSASFDPDFVATTSVGTMPVTAIAVGESYTILTTGTTNYVAIGAANNNPGTVFTATAVGTGTGTVSGQIYSRSSTTNSANNTSGSFDYSTGTTTVINNFDLERVVPANRLWVTLNGNRLYEGQDYYMLGTVLMLTSGTIALNQILAVTIFTDSVVPDEASFRIFQDMRGVQATYRITAATTTRLVAPLAALDDVIYVADAAVLMQPDLTQGIFGVITIGGERITYRQRDLGANTVSGLRRGTAGTGAAAHNTGDAVYSMGRGQLLGEAYQDYYVSDTSVGDGSTTVFYAPNITAQDFGDSSTVWVDSIEVYVEGQRQYRYGQAGNSSYNWIATDVDPVAIEFVAPPGVIDPVIAPPAGVEITIVQRRGTWWYDITTAATRADSLQENPGEAARFLTDRQTG